MNKTNNINFNDHAYALMQLELDRVLAVIKDSDALDSPTLNLFTSDLAAWRHVLAVSPFVAGHLLRRPKLLPDLIAMQAQGFNAERMQQQLGGIVDRAEFDRQLRNSRNEAMVLIAIRDLQGLAALEETLDDLSALAETLVEICLHWHYEKLARRYGYPMTKDGSSMPLVILAMGKLGARELNFSSDIDLILAYETDGFTKGALAIAHHEFFVKLAQQLHQSLDKMTEDGFVFRVDLRLRPYGNSGPLVMSFVAVEDYYQTQGREWERFAMIRARAIGSDTAPGARLLEQLQPFVYRRYLDFRVIQSLRDLKVMIDRETASKKRQDDLKLGPGGIREIEFIAQVFQLMRGGRDLALRSRSTPEILMRLAERDLLSRAESERLLAAWQYLRNAENHIQMMHDRQEHTLPTTEVDRQRLSLSMGCENWVEFSGQLAEQRQQVQESFNKIFADAGEQGEASPSRLFWLGANDEEVDAHYLSKLGYIDFEKTAQRIQTLKSVGVYRRLSEHGQALMDDLLPAIIDLSASVDNPDETLLRLLSVITAIAQRESYLALLLEVPSSRQQLTRLCGASAWITEVISRHPILLDELIDPRRLYAPPNRQDINVAMTRTLADMDADDVEAQMERLRGFKQAQQLRVAAADIMQTMPLMRVSDHLTWIAESVVIVALELAWEYLIARHGRPMYVSAGKQIPAQFGIIGFGKLGGVELGYGSDLDLVFVHDSQGASQITSGDKSVDNGVFFTRLAQRFVHLLSTLTPSGVLYEIDMRLRPNGKSGPLVTSLSALSLYQQQEAWTWEHQALVRARPIAGGQQVCDVFQRIRRQVLTTPRERIKLVTEVVEMRQRMRVELDTSNAEKFDLKQGAGGIVDIEFMVQYAVLSEAAQYPAMLEFTDTIRLAKAASETDLITTGQAQELIDIYQQYRSHLHHRVLQGLDHCVPLVNFEAQRARVIQIWQQLFEQE